MSNASPATTCSRPPAAGRDGASSSCGSATSPSGRLSDAFDIEAFLHGLATLSEDQQDILANAVNERLDDLYLAARVPYLATVEPLPCRCQDPLTVLDELLAAESTEAKTASQTDPKHDRERSGLASQYLRIPARSSELIR